MNWSYRNFEADPKGSLPRFSYQPKRQNGRLVAIEQIIDIEVYLMGDSTSEVESRVQDFMAECSQDGGDFVYSFADGSEATGTIRSTDAIGGVRVIQSPSFEDPQPGDYSVFRKGRVRFAALLRIDNIPVGAIIQWDETIQLDNPKCLPAREVVELLRKPAVSIQPRSYGIGTGSQSGTLIAFGNFPGVATVPGPRWPNAFVPGLGAGVIQWPNPIRYDGIPIAFGVSYSYRFVFNQPVSGNAFPGYL
jgi:hypothetical protein